MTQKQMELIYGATVRVADCEGCGTHLGYQPVIGEEAECPNCHTVHRIIDGGFEKLEKSVQTLKTPK